MDCNKKYGNKLPVIQLRTGYPTIITTDYAHRYPVIAELQHNILKTAILSSFPRLHIKYLIITTLCDLNIQKFPLHYINCPLQWYSLALKVIEQRKTVLKEKGMEFP